MVSQVSVGVFRQARCEAGFQASFEVFRRAAPAATSWRLALILAMSLKI